MKKGDSVIWTQLLNSLEEAELKLEAAYKNREYDNFDKIRNMILNIQNKILEGI